MLTVVVDEHGKAAGVVGAFFGAGEHQVNVGVAVRDEALHAALLYGRGRNPPRSSPGPALIVVPFGSMTETRPGRVLRYPHCGAQTPPRNAWLTATCPALSEIRLVLA